MKMKYNLLSCFFIKQKKINRQNTRFTVNKKNKNDVKIFSK